VKAKRNIFEYARRNAAVTIIFCVSLLLFTFAQISLLVILNKNVLNPSRARASSGDIAWQVFDGGKDDPGSNYNESVINTSNVSGMQQLWSYSLPAVADNAVVEQPNVSTSQGTVDLVFVNTIKGNLLALNASTGSKVWEADPSTADFNGQGTKSAPAVDPSGNYVYAYAVDGYVHKYNITNGTEVTGTGFPAQVTLLPNDTEKGSASLNIANGYLYMTLSGNDGDYGHYVGHVVAVNLLSGTKTVWNAECSNLPELLDATSTDTNYCSDTQSGIWARPGVKVDPVTGNVFVATGNGLYNANSGGHDWGDSLLELKPDLSQIVDSYTPTTYSSLQSGDADLGSTAPAILPTQSSSNTPYMLVQCGKDHIVRLLNRSNLSGAGAPGHTGGELQTITISDETHEQPAVWVDGSNNTWVFITDESGDLYAYKLVTTAGTSKLVQQYTKNLGTSSSPFVANGVLYIDGNSILAINPTTGATLFDSSSIGISLNQHWESPVVVNGALFTPDDNGNVYALYVPGATSNHLPLYRLFNPTSGEHFYTTDSNELNTLTARGLFRSEGIPGYLGHTSGSGLLAVYRLFNPTSGEHFYTTDANEESTLVAKGLFRLESVIGYVSSASGSGLSPLYRLFNPTSGEHFYTTDQNEENTLTSLGIFRSEGVVGYLYGN
jgi:outer membrane protein assembly factor BamB